MGGQDDTRKLRRQLDWSRKEAEIRRLVHENRYELTSHVYDKIATNYWELEDVLASLLNGSIQRAEKDELGDAVDGKKYTILGRDCYGHFLETLGKIVQADDGREYLVVTAY
jgi:hypothetical protein